MTLRAEVIEALDRVVDPCSLRVGVPLGLHEMGLVRALEVDERAGTVGIRLCLTAPCCAYGPAMADAARTEVGGLGSVRRVTVELDLRACWTPEDITPAANVRLDARRRRTLEVSGATPYPWPTPSGSKPEGATAWPRS